MGASHSRILSPSVVVSESLRRETDAFGTAFGLTKREREIVTLVALGVVTIKGISGALGVSPNTVNNHMNSVFTKTQTRSKAEVLARFLAHMAESTADNGLAVREVHLLAVGDELRELADELAERGLSSHWVSSVDAMVPFVDLGAFSITLMPASLANEIGAAASHQKGWPTSIWPVFIVCGTNRDVRSDLELGFLDVSTVDAEAIVALLAFHLARTHELRRESHGLRWRDDGPANGSIAVKDRAWGRSGFVVSREAVDAVCGPDFATSLQVGEMFEAKVSRGKSEWQGDLQLAWKSDVASDHSLGFRFWPHRPTVEWFASVLASLDRACTIPSEG